MASKAPVPPGSGNLGAGRNGGAGKHRNNRARDLSADAENSIENDAEDDLTPPIPMDKNGPEYVNLRGIVGRVHSAELSGEELKLLEAASLWPASKTKGKFFHEFSQAQIDVLAEVRTRVWERQIKKEFPDNERLRQELEQKRIQTEDEARRQAQTAQIQAGLLASLPGQHQQSQHHRLMEGAASYGYNMAQQAQDRGFDAAGMYDE